MTSSRIGATFLLLAVTTVAKPDSSHGLRGLSGDPWSGDSPESGNVDANAWGCPRWAARLGWCRRDDQPQCPVVKPVSPFDLDRYIEHTWYVQKQQENGYQKKEDLYCVTATYNRKDGNSGLLKVENRANRGGVNGELRGESSGFGSYFSSLCAQPQSCDSNGSCGKLRVQPCFLFQWGIAQTAGPYWVLAVDSENYEWAVISGGQPTETVGQGPSTECTTKTEGINNSGLWLFTRQPIPDAQVVARMEAKLQQMGVATERLLAVAQEGCSYDKMPIKP